MPLLACAALLASAAPFDPPLLLVVLPELLSELLKSGSEFSMRLMTSWPSADRRIEIGLLVDDAPEVDELLDDELLERLVELSVGAHPAA